MSGLPELHEVMYEKGYKVLIDGEAYDPRCNKVVNYVNDSIVSQNGVTLNFADGTGVYIECNDLMGSCTVHPLN